MGEGKIPRSQRIFRGMLRALPEDFRANYGGEMEGVFHEQRREAEERGGLAGLLKLWSETLAGIFRTAPREHWEILKLDVAYALRMMQKNAGFTAVAVLTLALGIGANTAIFSVVHSVLLRPLPYRDGQQLVFVRQQAQKEKIDDIGFSVHEIEDYRAQNSTLSGLVEYHTMSFILYGHGDPDRVRTAVVSHNYFELFGVTPLVGRTFVAEDDKIGAPPVLILSYEYWKNKFGGDPKIVGQTFEMNDKPHTVVGVLPPVPQYPVESDVFMPTSACPFRSSAKLIENRGARMMEVFGRTKPGVTLGQAKADLAAIAGRLRKDYPNFYPEPMGYTAGANLLRDELTHDARPTLLVLLAAAGFVLLIACANVANLTLARTSQRERELALRTALGAGRSRLLRQLLTESLLLALTGGLVGLSIAWIGLPLLTDFAARMTARAREIQIDTSVLIFALAAALGTSIVFGSVAALFARANLTASLKEGSAGAGAGRRRNRVRGTLIVSQIAFSVVLLAGAGLMLRSLVKMLEVDAGFHPQRVMALSTTFSFSKYATDDQFSVLTKKVLEQAKEVPGVIDAAIASFYPLQPEAIQAGASAFSGAFEIEGRPLNPGEAPRVGGQVNVTPGYFGLLGIPLKAGREFTEADDGKHEQVVMINEAVKRQYWPNEDPIGKHVSGDNGKTWATIIGIVGDVREFGLDHPPATEFYVPQTESPSPGTLLVRTAADPHALAQALTRAVHAVDSQAAVTRVRTLEDVRSESVAPPRVMASLLGIFALVALVIAAAGIGGMMALNVSQRVREIGIRMALGAEPSAVLRTVLGQGLTLAALGVTIGIAGALALTGLVKSLLFGVKPTDPLTFAAVAIVLAAAAAVASYLPARRAAAIDPIEALRTE
jgi:putative ABC transport system permease protein